MFLEYVATFGSWEIETYKIMLRMLHDALKEIGTYNMCNMHVTVNRC